MIGEALVRTGAAQQIGDFLNAKSGGNETRLLVLLMVAGAGLGAFMCVHRGGRDLHPDRAAHLPEHRRLAAAS